MGGGASMGGMGGRREPTAQSSPFSFKGYYCGFRLEVWTLRRKGNRDFTGPNRT